MFTINVIQRHFNKLENGSNLHSYSQGLFLLIFFIAILILLPTLFLCAHLCCRRRRLLSPQPAAETASSPHDRQLVSVDYVANSLISIAAGGDGFDEKNKECCICLCVFKESEKVKVVIECQHAYHSECLDTWLSANSSCPLCRASLLHVCNSLVEKSTISS